MNSHFLPSSTRKLLDAKAVAERCGCSERTVYRMADGGQMPHGVKLNKLRRWDSVEIDEWFNNGCRPIVDPRSRK